jgi:hypothetical protein
MTARGRFGAPAPNDVLPSRARHQVAAPGDVGLGALYIAGLARREVEDRRLAVV